MAHAESNDWHADRIEQVERMLDAGYELSQMVAFLNNDGFWRFFEGKDTTEDFVFNTCLIILAKRMEAKQG